MSIAAGRPTAAAFAEYLSESIREIDPQYSGDQKSFAATAADFEALSSRQELVSKVRDMLFPPQGLHETTAHRTAIQTFNLILTTNWDDLLEQALSAAHDERPVISRNVSEQPPERALIKLHGSLDDVPSLLLTEADASQMDRTHVELWEHARAVLKNYTIVVVGMSLRDPSIVKLFEESGPQRQGYFVAPVIDAATKARLSRWNLVCVQATAEEFFWR